VGIRGWNYEGLEDLVEGRGGKRGWTLGAYRRGEHSSSDQTRGDGLGGGNNLGGGLSGARALYVSDEGHRDVRMQNERKV